MSYFHHVQIILLIKQTLFLVLRVGVHNDMHCKCFAVSAFKALNALLLIKMMSVRMHTY